MRSARRCSSGTGRIDGDCRGGATVQRVDRRHQRPRGHRTRAANCPGLDAGHAIDPRLSLWHVGLRDHVSADARRGRTLTHGSSREARIAPDLCDGECTTSLRPRSARSEAPGPTPTPVPTPTVLARVDGGIPDGRGARRGGRGGGQRALGGAGLLPSGTLPARGKPAGAPAAPPQLPPSSTFLLHHRLCAARAAFRGTKERTTAHTPVLHACVVQVVADFGGVVPTTVDELMSPAPPVRKESARPVPWRGGGSQGRGVAPGARGGTRGEGWRQG